MTVIISMLCANVDKIVKATVPSVSAIQPPAQPLASNLGQVLLTFYLCQPSDWSPLPGWYQYRCEHCVPISYKKHASTGSLPLLNQQHIQHLLPYP